jgi:hypothetical protein
MDFKVIATDFDGTLCENKWPDIGEPNDEIIWYLREQQAAGVKIILWTCRADERLEEAVRWCYDQEDILREKYTPYYGRKRYFDRRLLL